ncbi:MAG: 4-hydroxy-3-methylbut-2-enyl diphosphate reductase [Pelagibacteraceae bacterium]|nr:4-hydroxy-3-methylbut-2-enyl diphosphate reductase [Pelagibacteraceae bacterium]|tara:strand:- start:30633 stop:31580 length:948 start_codon:yes stop_codon:yes gene_type:complete
MNKKIDIYLAGPRGFCAGVERAILMVKEAIKKYGSPVYVRHEIVHNKYVVDNLKAEGAIFVEELDEITQVDRPVIFSAHGVPKSVPQEAKKLNLLYYDATCPLVSKIHREVENFDRKKLPVILIGHHNHPEVIGTMGQTAKQIYLVENKEDIKKLPIPKTQQVAYVTQTTLSVDDTKEIINEIKLYFENVLEPKKKDICYATTNRQKAVKNIAKDCDYFFVLGSQNSSNSLRLVEVAKNYGSKKAFLIDNIDIFDPRIISDRSKIGITASASSPEILVNKILNKIEKYFEINIIESYYEKEDTHFKIPQKLKEAI